MYLATFLNIAGACIGFASALFFAVGTLRLQAQDIVDIAGTYYDFNEHLADSIASQRAEYIVGALLLLLSFGAQIAGNLAPSQFVPELLQSPEQAWLGLVVLFIAILVCAAILTTVLARSTQRAVQKLLKQRTESQR